MKRVLAFLLGLVIPLLSFAQTIDDIGKIVIGVKVLPSATQETKDNQVLLQNRITSLAANAGFSSYGNNAFIITPSITISDTRTAEGGMKNIYVMQGELFLNVQEGQDGTVFLSTSFPFKGSGTSKAAAVKDGIQKISYGNMKPFFDEAKSKILNYYNAMQEKIFANADMLAQNKDFDAAIATLLTIPEELFEPYQKAYAKACEIYQMRDVYVAEQIALEIQEMNNEVLVKARSLMAAHDAVATLEALWDYHIAGTDQDKEYEQLLHKAEARITADEQAALEKAKQEYEDRRMKEEREYNDRRKEYEDEVEFRRRQFDLENKRADYERATQMEMTEAVKTVALEYCRTNNTYAL